VCKLAEAQGGGAGRTESRSAGFLVGSSWHEAGSLTLRMLIAMLVGVADRLITLGQSAALEAHLFLASAPPVVPADQAGNTVDQPHDRPSHCHCWESTGKKSCVQQGRARVGAGRRENVLTGWKFTSPATVSALRETEVYRRAFRVAGRVAVLELALRPPAFQESAPARHPTKVVSESGMEAFP
jgi:hypothetical protein